MCNGASMAGAAFEHELNEFKSVQVTRIMHDFYDADPARGFYGGGGIDARLFYHPMLWGVEGYGPPDAPRWGSEYKALLRDYPRTMFVNGHTTSLPVESNSISLDPTVKDAWGCPAIRMTYRDHPDDLVDDALHAGAERGDRRGRGGEARVALPGGRDHDHGPPPGYVPHGNGPGRVR